MMIISRYIYHIIGQGETPMVNLRTIVTLSENDKIWLENYSKITGISMAEAIRRGIAQLREREEKNIFQTLIEETRGIWSKEDGLEYQEKLRAEWR